MWSTIWALSALLSACHAQIAVCSPHPYVLTFTEFTTVYVTWNETIQETLAIRSSRTSTDSPVTTQSITTSTLTLTSNTATAILSSPVIDLSSTSTSIETLSLSSTPEPVSPIRHYNQCTNAPTSLHLTPLVLRMYLMPISFLPKMGCHQMDGHLGPACTSMITSMAAT